VDLQKRTILFPPDENDGFSGFLLKRFTKLFSGLRIGPDLLSSHKITELETCMKFFIRKLQKQE